MSWLQTYLHQVNRNSAPLAIGPAPSSPSAKPSSFTYPAPSEKKHGYSTQNTAKAKSNEIFHAIFKISHHTICHSPRGSRRPRGCCLCREEKDIGASHSLKPLPPSFPYLIRTFCQR